MLIKKIHAKIKPVAKIMKSEEFQENPIEIDNIFQTVKIMS